MLDTYIDGGGNIEISDDRIREEVGEKIASGFCKIVNHPEGWDEFSDLKLEDGRTLEGSYEWDCNGFRSLRIVEDGERLRDHGVTTEEE